MAYINEDADLVHIHIDLYFGKGQVAENLQQSKKIFIIDVHLPM